jgi:site-specific DNA-cytosine methylase
VTQKGGKQRMKVAVICEYSGTVRDAFIKLGHDAISFDILPTDSPGPHIQQDIMELPLEYWKQFDLAICHPPCTHLAVSGARHFAKKLAENPNIQKDALDFVQYLMDLPIGKIVIENPISIISSHIRKPDQIIQPWMFGHGETKATCLWLKNLEKLEPTNIVEGRDQNIWTKKGKPKGVPLWKWRSTTFKGIADAMAEQWGGSNTLIFDFINDYLKTDSEIDDALEIKTDELPKDA